MSAAAGKPVICRVFHNKHVIKILSNQLNNQGLHSSKWSVKHSNQFSPHFCVLHKQNTSFSVLAQESFNHTCEHPRETKHVFWGICMPMYLIPKS